MKSLLRIDSLQQRLVAFLLLPSALMLLAAGVVGFYYARNVMLDQWREKVSLQLERAAHHIDMRLGRPIEYIDMFNRTGLIDDRRNARRWIIRQLESIDGVSRVSLTVDAAAAGTVSAGADGMGGRHGDMAMRFMRGDIARIAPPTHDTTLGVETVSLVSLLYDDNDRPAGRLEVVVRFDHLIAGIISLGWWHSQAAGIVEDDGRYLVHTDIIGRGHDRLGDDGDILEIDVRRRLGQTSGTLFGPGHPPRTVAGFHRLEQAPWTIVMFASGDTILGPIIRFRNYFFMGWTAFALLLLALVRINVVRIVTPIRRLSASAEAVSRGDYGPPVRHGAKDEIGQLIDSYNRMVEGLQERDMIRNTFGRYVDPNVARKLLNLPEFSRIGGTKRQVVILMADIRGFTAMTEHLDPDAVIRMLNHYFSVMIATVHRQGGIIVDFIGDGLLVFFEPMDASLADAAGRGFDCACGMQTGTAELNPVLTADGLPEIRMGIGLNVGEVIVGNIGSVQRAKYGIVGSAVNLTQRIQAQAGPSEIVASAALLPYLADRRPTITRRFTAAVKGVSAPLSLAAVLPRSEDGASVEAAAAPVIPQGD